MRKEVLDEYSAERKAVARVQILLDIRASLW